jgi:type I restriction enzyme S subunit
MKRYKTYALYKPSGVEWLGDIPEHWELRRLKSVITTAINGVWGEDAQDDKNDMVCIRVADFDYSKFGISPDNLTLRNIDPSQQLSRALKKGDLLIEKSGGGDNQLVGRVVSYNIDERAVCSNFIGRLLPNEDVNYRFLCYVFAAMYAISYNIQSIKQTTGIQNLDLYSYLCEQFALPPLQEQQSLASFLDSEITRIDTLITKKSELINLLQKKRAAIITNTVTKGLKSNVSMRDSNIDWLRKIPAHWEISRLKFLTSQITVGIVVTPAKYYVDNGIPCLRSLNIKEGKLLDSNLVFISSESNNLHKKSMIFEGDLVIVRTGQPGATAVVDKRFHGTNCIDLIIVRQSRHFNSYYLSYLANSDFAQTQVVLGSGGAIQQHFNIGTAANLQILVPPIIEQIEIVNFLNQEVSKMNNLISKVEKSISALQQYRSALITAAVTGKIDVREEVNRKSA